MPELIHFWWPRRELHSRPEVVRGAAALGKMLHHLLEAIREGISAQREYERRTSMGVGHDPALKAALSEMRHCRQGAARRPLAWRCRPYRLKTPQTRSPALGAQVEHPTGDQKLRSK
jgi:hypothetical protein